MTKGMGFMAMILLITILGVSVATYNKVRDGGDQTVNAGARVGEAMPNQTVGSQSCAVSGIKIGDLVRVQPGANNLQADVLNLSNNKVIHANAATGPHFRFVLDVPSGAYDIQVGGEAGFIGQLNSVGCSDPPLMYFTLPVGQYCQDFPNLKDINGKEYVRDILQSYNANPCQ